MREFKNEFLAAWKSGATHDALLEIVARFEGKDGPRQIYDELQSIWQECGYDSDENCPLRDELEFVMEKVWYRCPA